LGTTTLLSGECQLTKNGAPAGKSVSTLAYDQDLGFFKVITAGNIWMSFKTGQISGAQVFVTGAIVKKHHVSIVVKFATGDEYGMDFVAQNEASAMTAKEWIDNLARIGRVNTDIQNLAKVREKVPMSEVGKVLAKHGLPNSPADSVRMTELMIASGGLDGVVEGDTFVSRQAKQREVVNYQVVSSFDIGKNGLITLKCPSCGSPVQMRDSSPTKKCDYCSTEFMVPKRVLDLL